jgi:hypothetical protein
MMAGNPSGRKLKFEEAIEMAAPEQNKPEDTLSAMERYGRIEDMDRSFDIQYWQRQGSEAIFRAAWELVEFAYRHKGLNPDDLRIQRTVESFQRLER